MERNLDVVEEMLITEDDLEATAAAGYENMTPCRGVSRYSSCY